MKEAHFEESLLKLWYNLGTGIVQRQKACGSTQIRKPKRYSQHEGLEEDPNRFFWNNMLRDITEYIKRCEQYQKHGKMQNVISPELQSASVPTEVMRQIGADI